MLEVLLQLCHGHLVGLGLRALVAAVVPPPMPPTPPPPAVAAWQLDQQSVAVQDQVLAVLLKVTLRPPAGRPPVGAARHSSCVCLRAKSGICAIVTPPSNTAVPKLMDKGAHAVCCSGCTAYCLVRLLRIAEAYAGCAMQITSLRAPGCMVGNAKRRQQWVVQVLALVPTAPSRALPLMVGRLPHKTRDTNAHCVALRAAFAVAGSPAGATIRDEVLAAVVDKLLELDVEIAWQDISERPGAGHALRIRLCSLSPTVAT